MSDITATTLAGFGGFIVASKDGCERVLSLVTSAGQLLHFALTREQLSALVSKAIELQTIELEAGELLHELKVYGE
ncbi:hypothetical protein [Mycobacterium sp. ZZG]